MLETNNSTNHKELIVMEGIYKSFPGVQALETADVPEGAVGRFEHRRRCGTL